MTTATKAGTSAFCKSPGRCMIRCHDCGCDQPDWGPPLYCEKDHPAPAIRREMAAGDAAQPGVGPQGPIDLGPAAPGRTITTPEETP